MEINVLGHPTLEGSLYKLSLLRELKGQQKYNSGSFSVPSFFLQLTLVELQKRDKIIPEVTYPSNNQLC